MNSKSPDLGVMAIEKSVSRYTGCGRLVSANLAFVMKIKNIGASGRGHECNFLRLSQCRNVRGLNLRYRGDPHAIPLSVPLQGCNFHLRSDDSSTFFTINKMHQKTISCIESSAKPPADEKIWSNHARKALAVGR